MTTAIYGTPENGERLPVAFGAYAGMAGVRMRPGGREVAYFGADPGRFPAKGTIDGVEVTATAKRDSRIRGAIVLWVPDAG